VGAHAWLVSDRALSARDKALVVCGVATAVQCPYCPRFHTEARMGRDWFAEVRLYASRQCKNGKEAGIIAETQTRKMATQTVVQI